MTENALILASTSVTRSKMLEQAGLDFQAIPPGVDESEIKASLISDGYPPLDIAYYLAESKARAVALSYPDKYVIGSDQILEHEGRLFSKPTTLSGARNAIIDLAGSSHHLISAVAIAKGDQVLWRHAETAKLTMRDLNFRQIDAYLAQVGDQAFWSVGSYQVEDKGIQLFEDIEGDFFSILGMPLLPVLRQLRHYGFDTVVEEDKLAAHAQSETGPAGETDAPANDD